MTESDVKHLSPDDWTSFLSQNTFKISPNPTDKEQKICFKKVLFYKNNILFSFTNYKLKIIITK